MIFFFSSPKHQDPTEPLREQFSSQELDKAHATAKAKLRPWHSFYDGLDALLNAIMVEADEDPVCRAMIARFKEHFDLDLSSSDPKVISLWEEVVSAWSNPMVGNLEGMENKAFTPRAMTGENQAKMWSKNKAIAVKENQELFNLLKEMPPPDRSPRDQVRVFQSITSAARAVTGEVTCCVSNRLEKLLALRLCLSGELLDKQKSLIRSCLHTQGGNILQAINDDGEFATSAQYCSYYMPKMANLTTVKGRQALFLELINQATDANVSVPTVEVEEDQTTIRDCLKEFRKLPPVIRCAMLINDIKRVNKSIAGVKVETFARIIEARRDYHKVLPEGRPSKYIPQINAFITKWNQDEYSPTVMTYRTRLCPLWGGASGHMHGLMHFWSTAATDAPKDMSQTVACSMFTFWRLFYDKRITPVHTSTETFEATFNQDVSWGTWSGFAWQPSRDESAWKVVARCAVSKEDGYVGIDPIKLMETLFLWAWPAQSFWFAHRLVKQLINSARKAITDAGYLLPEWSHDTTVSSGTGVRTYHPRGDEWEPSGGVHINTPFPPLDEAPGLRVWGSPLSTKE